MGARVATKQSQAAGEPFRVLVIDDDPGVRDYMEALVYKGLLLRVQANLEKDASKQAALIKEATALKDQAEEIKKKRTAGAAGN